MGLRGQELALALSVIAWAPAVARAAEPAPGGAALSSPPADNVVFAEIFGSGIVPSVNYARRFGSGTLRIGFGYWSGSEPGTSGTNHWSYASIPLTSTGTIGRGPFRLELGGGISFVHMTVVSLGGSPTFPWVPTGGTVSAWVPMAIGIIGVRYSPPGPGFTAALTFTPVLAVLANAQAIGADQGARLGFLPWGGASAGYQF